MCACCRSEKSRDCLLSPPGANLQSTILLNNNNNNSDDIAYQSFGGVRQNDKSFSLIWWPLTGTSIFLTVNMR